MSQISEQLEKMKPAYIDTRLEATTILMEEMIKLLSPEQQGELIEAIAARHPGIKDNLSANGATIDYQLSLSLNKCINRRD
ncbi:TPA: hypothetical protein ACOEHG_005121 [Enterobacter ludwigii]